MSKETRKTKAQVKQLREQWQRAIEATGLFNALGVEGIEPLVAVMNAHARDRDIIVEDKDQAEVALATLQNALEQMVGIVDIMTPALDWLKQKEG
jgi:hypothetical protein